MKDLLPMAIYAYTKARNIHPVDLAAEIGMSEETMVAAMQGGTLRDEDRQMLLEKLRLVE